MSSVTLIFLTLKLLFAQQEKTLQENLKFMDKLTPTYFSEKCCFKTYRPENIHGIPSNDPLVVTVVSK